jgi:hypothetical protein
VRHESGPPQAASADKNSIATGTRDGNLHPAEASTPEPAESPGPLSMLEWALAYAKAGTAVFPCKWWPGRGSKAPLVPPPGFHLATIDPHQIADWWIQWPDALIGSPVLPTRCAIDIDPRNGGSVETLENLAGALVPTLTVWSGRKDGGRHLFYRRPKGELTQTRIKKLGCDLKDGGKGYTILPPSLHPDTGQPYRWEIRPLANMSRELFELIHYEPPVARLSSGRRPVSPGSWGYSGR